MTKKEFDWEHGVTLDEHSRRKHRIIKSYLRKYLITRCQLPQLEKFRLAIVDGFSGGGRYEDGSPGSPVIVLDTLRETLREINISRNSRGMKNVEIECIVIFNDVNNTAIKQLKETTNPIIASINDEDSHLHIEVEHSCRDFNECYSYIKHKILNYRFHNVFFNLDQGGYKDVDHRIVGDIMQTWRSAEVMLTFMIQSFLAYLSLDPEKTHANLQDPELMQEIYQIRGGEKTLITKKEWLGKVEKFVFDHLKLCAPFVSPFSINNPDGWRYWLIHFANSYRARQVYNDVLHDNNSLQAHFGRSGLRMLAYDPRDEAHLYLFGHNSREVAKEELYEDIPKLILSHGDTLQVSQFYSAAYNETPAHSDDINEMIMANPDIEVITETGGRRRAANTIRPDDTLKIKEQKTFPLFIGRNQK